MGALVLEAPVVLVDLQAQALAEESPLRKSPQHQVILVEWLSLQALQVAQA